MVTLSKEQQLQEILKRKDTFNYKESFYKCDLCYKGFLTNETFKNHMERHDVRMGNFICDICKSRWRTLRALTSHKSTHEKRFICKICAHTTKSYYRSKEHVKWHNGYMYQCASCTAVFAKSTTYMTHVRTHHPSNINCKDCGESFLSENGLMLHKKKAHITENNGLQVHLECTNCEVKFKNLAALKQHRNISDDGVCDTSQSPCDQCGHYFSSEELLKEHQKNSHKVYPVKCDECDRLFANDRTFGIHYQRLHLGIKVRKHERRYPRKKPPVVCEVCGKICISKSSLLCHQRIHTGEKPFHCTICPKSFGVLQRLQIHTRTHTGERPFKCSNCPKAFKHKAALNRHMRVHTGAKPYPCMHCLKSFSQSNSMKLHVRTVHLKIPQANRNQKKKTIDIHTDGNISSE